jgi:transposase
MKPYSLDLRERVVSAIEMLSRKGTVLSDIAQRFAVSKTCVERWVIQKRTEGHVVSRKQGGSMTSPAMEHKEMTGTRCRHRLSQS